jgi:hypothetical protein
MAQIFPYRSRRKYSESEGVNRDNTYDIRCQAFGKSPSDVSPYLIANEWIAASVGQFLRLPIPPFSIMGRKGTGTRMFASYSFTGDRKTDKKMLSADPASLYKTFPDECTGVVLFDILIGNVDRNYTNIKVDRIISPKNFYIFDHERALFHLYPDDGIARLRSLSDRLGITDGSDSHGDEFHCLIGQLDSVELMGKWLHRILAMPNWYIEDVCSAVRKISIRSRECTAVIEFLKRRRDNLEKLILDNKPRFPGVKQWPAMFLK